MATASERIAALEGQVTQLAATCIRLEGLIEKQKAVRVTASRPAPQKKNLAGCTAHPDSTRNQWGICTKCFVEKCKECGSSAKALIEFGLRPKPEAE
jgi:hypothetical protein